MLRTRGARARRRNKQITKDLPHNRYTHKRTSQKSTDIDNYCHVYYPRIAFPRGIYTRMVPPSLSLSYSGATKFYTHTSSPQARKCECECVFAHDCNSSASRSGGEATRPHAHILSLTGFPFEVWVRCFFFGLQFCWKIVAFPRCDFDK